MIEKICPICNTAFMAKTKRAIYCCRSCNKKAEAARLRQANLEKRLQGKTCEKCGKIFIPKQYGLTRKYCFECIPDGLSNGSEIRKQIKKWALEYKGNKCSKCGYNRCINALEFHHKDMTEKEFSISDHTIKLDWKQIQEELEKCEVLCANCHREVHAELFKGE